MSGSSRSGENSSSLVAGLTYASDIQWTRSTERTSRLLDAKHERARSSRMISPDPVRYFPATHHVQLASSIRPSPVWYLPGPHHVQLVSLIRPVAMQNMPIVSCTRFCTFELLFSFGLLYFQLFRAIRFTIPNRFGLTGLAVLGTGAKNPRW